MLNSVATFLSAFWPQRVSQRLTLFVLYVFVLTLLVGQTARAAVIVIDGAFADWSGTAGQVDVNGPDDEGSPQRADITEYRVAATATNAFLLFAWDDTGFNGGNATTAGMSIKGANGTTYRVYATANGSPATVAASTLQVQRCADSTCASESIVCDLDTNTATPPCAGVAVGAGPTWVDPFATRTRPLCSGTACGTRDTAVEIQMPWSLIGGTPTGSQYAFFQFGSYPSGPGQGAKDATQIPGGNGVSCFIAQGQLTCAPTTPTVIDLVSFRATWQNDRVAVTWQTATEQHTLGFYVLRSETRQRADAQRITPELVPAQGDALTGAAYLWKDMDVNPEGAFTYWLQEVETTGAVNDYGPVHVRGPDAPPLNLLQLPFAYR